MDVKAARARGIAVSNVPIYGTDAVAEYVFALLLNFYRQPQLHSELIKHGEWSKAEWCFWRTPLTEVAGQTLGIVGFGRIGRRVGEIAAAFKMKVLANDVFRGNPPSYPFEWREVPELFAESDVVTLHCNLTPENTGMVNKALLARMKPTAYLINTVARPARERRRPGRGVAAGQARRRGAGRHHDRAYRAGQSAVESAEHHHHAAHRLGGARRAPPADEDHRRECGGLPGRQTDQRRQLKSRA